MIMIRNLRTKKTLAHKKTIGASIHAKAIGLMFSKRIHDEGLIFVFDNEGKRDLHMFSVFYPIDVIFLDKKKKIVELKEHFKPFTFYTAQKKSQYVIELPDSSIRKSKTKIGDRISF